MDKIKTLRKPRRSIKSGAQKITHKNKTEFSDYSPTQELMDDTFIAKAVWECLKNNDVEGVLEVLEAHLEVVNKVSAAKKTNLPRSTLYNALKGKNPTLKTLAKLVNCCF